ncbi:hypothetical protein CAPTEDRAFT_193826 [Capitella teleta]|uniref:Uncharacterized protein n=1 Tax=Capitella teleta TaxID=283909 RepID=R7UYM2_CAPTE|nr:hypothetical protein CAPTEDRAFT_193826 [Capitella teleta]|eukprot:ELU11424.1 hypothetical protein CAPTEDRAFT_193826 [Capitella teleta]
MWRLSAMQSHMKRNWAKLLGIALVVVNTVLLLSVSDSVSCSQPAYSLQLALGSNATGALYDERFYDGVPVASMKADVRVTMHQYGHRQETLRNRTSCLDIIFAGNGTSLLPSTALASFPGSGNTWTRHLIELSTGFYTGAIYKDGLLKKAFPGEGNRSRSAKIDYVQLHSIKYVKLL